MTWKIGLMVMAAAVLAAGDVAAAGDAAAGGQKAKACASCHGADGNGPTPLAGKDAAYLAQQLNDFRSGARTGSMMNMLAAGLSDQDIADLAAYYAAQRAR